jgi:hypothetical protein
VSEKIAFNLKEAVAASGLCRTTLYDLMKSGELAYSQIRGKRVILGTAIVELAERNRVGA